MSMTRKEFLGSLFGAAGVAALLGACGDDGGSSPDASSQRNCAVNGTNVNIADNHGHTLVVTPADVAAGADKTYNIQGASDHPHEVTVRAADFAKLQSNANASVQVVSTSDAGHTHTITILCA